MFTTLQLESVSHPVSFMVYIVFEAKVRVGIITVPIGALSYFAVFVLLLGRSELNKLKNLKLKTISTMTGKVFA